jgi:hypothetical protein
MDIAGIGTAYERRREEGGQLIFYHFFSEYWTCSMQRECEDVFGDFGLYI